MSLPLIAIVGRPNVGKSTLFNRLVGERLVITSPVAGTTRDRVYHETTIGSYRVILVDTGGLEFEKKKDIEADVQMQARIAIEEAHLIIFVVDATEPLTSSDLDCMQYLRKSKKPIILVAHKADSKKSEEMIPQLFELGLGEAVPASSIQNVGVIDVESAIDKKLKKMKWPKERARASKTIHIAIVGKPNVGKSSLVNGLLGKERLIVSNVPGTTVDSTDTKFHYNDSDYVLIDTAGIRRRGKRENGIEKYSVLRSLQAISRCDVTCLLIDGGAGIANQDLHVSQYILEAGKGLILVVNKSDLMADPEHDQKDFLRKLHYRMSFIPWAPAIFTSAVLKKNIFKIFELSKNIHAERMKKIPVRDFSIFLRATLDAHPPMRSGRAIIISTAEQTGVDQPEFTFYTHKPDLIHFSYRRFLENEIRRRFGFFGTPIAIKVKEQSPKRKA